MLRQSIILFLAALPMNLAAWSVDHQLHGNDAPFFLVERWRPLWDFALIVQPWSLLFLKSFRGAFIASGIAAVVYLAAWFLLTRIRMVRTAAARLRPVHGAILFAVVTLPYLALLAYALYVEHTYVPPHAG